MALLHDLRLPALLASGLALVLIAPVGIRPVGGEDSLTRPSQGERLFVEEVLPLFERSCFECHGPERLKPKGGLRLTSRAELVAGGESGAALVPGDPERSLLIQGVRYGDPLFQMPPDGPLAAEEVLLLERWIELGAPWPADVTPRATARARESDGPKLPGVGASEAAASVTAVEPLRLFETSVRPVLVEHCFECHGPDLDEVEGGLRMSGRDALLAGGDDGPAIELGDPDASLLVRAVRYEHRWFKMPPDGMLSERAIADIARWVELGAPWPESGPTKERLAEPSGHRESLDVEGGRRSWAFRPPVRPAVPAINDARIANPIDAFVFARLAEAGLEPSPPASRREQARRLWFDLLGLPPTPVELRAFEEDDAPDAWERLVERLLTHPEYRWKYGERWARHWLDVVRYAETNGYERDLEKPWAWRYRDWVARAFADDMPFDRFVREQLAGDELEGAEPQARVATGFYRLGAWDDEPDDPDVAIFDELDDVVRTIGEGFLGLTVACARCHDHKFDPFPQADYYRLLAFVQNLRPYDMPRYSLESPVVAPIDSSPASLEAWLVARQAHFDARNEAAREVLDEAREGALRRALQGQPPEVQAAFVTPEGERSAEQSALLANVQGLDPSVDEIAGGFTPKQRRRFDKLKAEAQAAFESFQGDVEWALVASEKGSRPEPTHVLVRGRPSSPAEAVEPRFPAVLCASDEAARASLPELPEDAPSSGRRRALAEWIASPENPLTARVIANRVWQHLFGAGIVVTPNDFGAQGVPPTHPELLDWLACELVERGWSLKELQRLILGSYTYRMASRNDDERALAVDPSASLLWRQRPRRLEAEAIRDTILAASGRLSAEHGGPPFFPRLDRAALAGGSRPGEGWSVSSEGERSRRSIYAHVKRGMLVPLLDVFDFPGPSLPVGARASTTIAPQCLTLLNGEFVNRQASFFAERVFAEAGAAPREQVLHAFALALAREPTPGELETCETYLVEQAHAFAYTPPALSFEPLVPLRLQIPFLQEVDGADVLGGPRGSWRYLKGEWGNTYNGTREMDHDRGAAALLEDAALGDGTLRARVRLAADTDSFGLLLRATAAEDFVRGLELRLDASAGTLELWRHEETSERVAFAPAALERERWHALEIDLAGPEIAVRLDGAREPLLAWRSEQSEHAPAGAGSGVRLIGGRVELDALELPTEDGVVHPAPDDPGPPERRALESLCLALFNLNEFLYVD